MQSLADDRAKLGTLISELEKPYLQEPYRHKLAIMKYRMERSLLQVQQRLRGESNLTAMPIQMPPVFWLICV